MFAGCNNQELSKYSYNLQQVYNRTVNYRVNKDLKMRDDEIVVTEIVRYLE